MIINNQNGKFNNTGIIGLHNTLTNSGTINSEIEKELNEEIDNIIETLNVEKKISEDIKNVLVETLSDLKKEKEPSLIKKSLTILNIIGSSLEWFPEKLEKLKALFGGF